MKQDDKDLKDWQKHLHQIIFEADTKEGKLFDIVILGMILLSVFLIILESIREVRESYGLLLIILEWVVTVAFTAEYVLRIMCLKRPWKYIFSFFGLVDLLSLIPSYLGIFIKHSHYLSVIRLFRLLRIFQIFKLTPFLRDSYTILISLRKSRHKIVVFLFFVFLTSVILGTLVYALENEVNPGFSNIPESVYWAIVTLSTVGYGDIAPVTVAGKIIASIIMIMGYSIIAVPTGIITAEMRPSKEVKTNTQHCANCSKDNHENGAKYCSECGEPLHFE